MCISTSVLYTPTLKTDILLYRGAVYPSSIWNFSLSLIRFGAFVPDCHRSVVKLLQCIFLLLHMRMTVQMQCCCFTLVFLFFFSDCISAQRCLVCSEWMHGNFHSTSGAQNPAGHSERPQPVRGHGWASQTINELYIVGNRYSTLLTLLHSNICHTILFHSAKVVIAFKHKIHQNSSEHVI